MKKNNIKLNIRFFACLIFFTVVIVIPVNADFKTWTGSVSTDWGTADNWNTSGVPTSVSQVIIPSNPTGGRFPTISSGNFSIVEITIRAGAILNQSNGTLTITNDIYINSGSPGGTYNQTGGLLQIADDWVNEGTFNSTGGTVEFTGPAYGVHYTTFASGTNQFYNIIVDSGFDPDFDLVEGSEIKIGGNFTNYNSSLDNSSNATFIFNGTGDQTIYSASSPVPTMCTFGNLDNEKTSGTITLLSDISVKGSFTPGTTQTYLNGNDFWVNDQIYDGPLPVELVFFNASVRNNSVILSWKTATEIQNYGFEIERSLDSKNWTKLGFINGHGNSNSPKEYSFEDNSYSKSGSYYYRLKQLDVDGGFSFSNTISVVIDQVPNNFELYQNYPNPFNPTTIIKYTITEESFVTVKVYNIVGSEIMTLVNEKLGAGSYECSFNASSLSSGAYIYKIQAGNFSATKKMILSK